jgi:hypothetical protein
MIRVPDFKALFLLPLLVAGPVQAANDTAPSPALRILVLDLQAEEVDPFLTRITTEALVLEIAKREGLSILRPRDLSGLADDAQGSPLQGCPDDACLAEMVEGNALDLIVRGRLIATDGTGTLSLTAIQVSTLQLAGSFQGRVSPPGPRTFLLAVGPAVQTLFEKHPLKAGETEGVDAQLIATMDPPPLRPWLFWTGLATTGALIALSGTAVGLSLVRRGEYQALVDDSEKNGTVIDGAELNLLLEEINLTSQIATAAGLGAVLFAAATGATIPFTDWQNLGAKRDALADLE